MLKLHACQIEADLISTGIAQAYGDVIAATQAFRFDDPGNGIYLGTGGLVGEGGVMVDRYQSTRLDVSMGETSFLNYEKALSGHVALGRGDTRLVTSNGTATVARQCRFELSFVPESEFVDGIEIAFMLDALYRHLRAGGEEGVVLADYFIVDGSGPEGVDASLLDLAGYVLAHFDAFRMGVVTRQSRLAEALLIECFAQMLRDLGVLIYAQDARDGGAPLVRRAEEYIRANYSDPITIADIAEAAGVTQRSLQLAFRRRFGMTPRQYLGSVRLAEARALLLTLEGSQSVTDVAFGCGIMHMGRFASAYRLRYGELPSQTLRRPN